MAARRTGCPAAPGPCSRRCRSAAATRRPMSSPPSVAYTIGSSNARICSTWARARLVSLSSHSSLTICTTPHGLAVMRTPSSKNVDGLDPVQSATQPWHRRMRSYNDCETTCGVVSSSRR
jgi:hypothetical protein